MKVTITIREEDSPEERTMTVYSLASLERIERFINLAITMEANDKGWVVVKKPEASGPTEKYTGSEFLMDTRPRVYIHDEMGQMNFSKEETADLWRKLNKKNE
jgi:hypothetical protein